MKSFDAELLIDAHAELGEGPVWDDINQVLWWVDIEPGHLNRFDPAVGQNQVFELGRRVGALALTTDGGLIVAAADGFFDFDPETGGLCSIVDPEADRQNNRFNDGKCDPAGRFWAGTMALDFESGAGALYRLDTDLRVERMLQGVTISNGLAWSADHETLYYIDSVPGSVSAFDFDLESGAIANRRVVIEMPEQMGAPDGMTIDHQDRLWVAHYGGSRVGCFDPESGRALAEILVPASQVTSCTFGGRDLSTLFITTAAQHLDEKQVDLEPHAGGVFVARTEARGFVADRFG